MNIYVETNFLLELAFVQEQHESCGKILELAETGKVTLILPAYCIAESYETLIRRANRRTQLANELAGELRQLTRSKLYKDEIGIDANQRIAGLLAHSSQEEDQRWIDVLERIQRVAEIIPLTSEIVLNAKQYRIEHDFKPQDSIVYSSVLHHLVSAGGKESFLITRDKKDYGDDPNIERKLNSWGCRLLYSFDDGYIQHFVNMIPSG